jgi:cytochrome oxidase assembly protein ShyY1
VTRRFPIFATLLVLVAVVIMIRLGFWQLSRAAEKEALIARYAQAQTLSADVPFPESAEAAAPLLYRHAQVDCRSVQAIAGVAGHNAKGETGLSQMADCVLADGTKARVVIGWARDPAFKPAWSGGMVAGVIAPGPRLVTDVPVAGLEANARPDPADVPNNHMAYAVQWFLFAATALVIYGIAVRKRLAGALPRR